MERTCLIATPTYDGKLSHHYVSSLFRSLVLLGQHGIRSHFAFYPGDCVLLRARSNLLQQSIEVGADDLVFVDADIIWPPEALLRLLSHDLDVVGMSYRTKQDDQQRYAVQALPGGKLEPDANWLCEVAGLPTGFLRLSRKAQESIWDAGHRYKDELGNERRICFHYGLQHENRFITADYNLGEFLREQGFTIYLDMKYTPAHEGSKIYSGDVRLFLESQQSA